MNPLPPSGRACGRSRFLAALLLGVAAAAAPAGFARAQDGDSTPTMAYYIGLRTYYDGEYKDALDTFLSEGRGAIKTTQSRWIDSICYHTMAGECYYQMGDLPRANEHFTSALKLYSAFSNWMIRVQFPPRVTAANRGSIKPVLWGASTRNARYGQYPSKMVISQGRVDNNEQYRSGGVVQPAVLFPICVQEIVRCTTLALRRRAELMGPVCPHDPLTAELITNLSRGAGLPNHWSECWVDVQLGLALLAGGKEELAVQRLQRSLLAAGEFDHPMTCVALFELGRVALAKGQYPVAAKMFEEATYSAAHYDDFGILEEAFRYGAITHMVSGAKGMYPPLEAAARWAKVKDFRQLRTSLLLSAAENQVILGQTKGAAALLDEARLAIGRRTMGSGWIGARLSYINAMALFQDKQIPAGNQSLDAAMAYMKHGSHWLYQIALADGLYTGGQVELRTAMDLFSGVLRDPIAIDWRFRPMESMAVLTTPHPLPIEHWFEVALVRKEHETAIEIAEHARRWRFFNSLAFGGRLESLRWILEAPPEVLPEAARLERQDLLAQYPAYDQLSKQAAALRQKLEAMPLVPADPTVARQQSDLLGQLGAASLVGEAMLREIALRREPAMLIFPPMLSTKEVLAGLPKGQAILVFFTTSRATYGFLLADGRYTYWQIKSAPLLARQLQAMLREMGHFEQNREVTLKELTESKWKDPAQKVLDMLLEGSRAELSQIEELVIVPDGLLWYVPFEALQQDVGGKTEPLILHTRVRYAPTASLAVADGRARRASGNAAVVVGKLFPRDEANVAQEAFQQIARVLPGSVALSSAPLPGPSSLYATLFDELIVLDDIVLSESGPYAWAPVQIDRNKPGNALSDWLTLPWGGPDVIILPGFHTAAEASLKRLNPVAPGQEVFLTVCGLMADGARTILLSRWRPGGQSSYDLVREFVQELPHTLPAEAWQRAVLVVAGTRLNLDAEPRIKRTTGDDPPRANHPFFWSGFMLIDPGVPAHKPAPAANPAPAVNQP